MQFDLSEYLDDFIKELKSLSAKFERDLELLRSGEYNNDTINEIFRVAHSIKGMSATMEFVNMEKLTHKEEDMLDKIRAKEIKIDDNIINILYESFNVTNLLLESIEMTATEDEVDEEIVKNVIARLNNVLGVKEKEEKPKESSDSFDQFYKALSELDKDSNIIYFCKITINKNSPLLSARAFMILTSLKGKENLICSAPKLENFSNKLFELHKEYLHILFSSENDIETVKEYLSAFPEVDEIKVKIVDSNNINFSFDEKDAPVATKEADIKEEVIEETNEDDEDSLIEDNLIEISSLDEITDIIEYIETDIINKDLDQMKKILCNLEETFISISNFFKSISISSVVNMLEKVDYLIVIYKNHKLGIEDSAINVFLKVFDILKKIVKDKDLLENKIFCDNIKEFTEELEIKILEESLDKEIKIGELLSKQKHISDEEINELLEKQKTIYKGRKLGEVALAENKVEAKDLIQALKIQKNSKEKKRESNEEMIRIPSSKADKLLDLLEELMMIQSQIEQNAVKVLDKETSLVKDMYKSFRITKDIQNLSISFRMITLHSIFQKVSINAHDAMKKLNKKVKLEISGESTEIDRIVGSKIVDPLLHLIKNSISHGIEDEDIRIQRNKNKTGSIFLSAYSEKGYVYISIADDGNGIDTDIVYKKALEKGIIDPNKKYSDDEIVNFIFLPGFSTTKEINQISGRGVGMDVVKTEIQKLRGRIIIKNKIGKGLTIQLRIPQNMTSLNGTIVKIKSKKYIIPSVFIKEVFRVEEEKYILIGGKKDFVKLREQVIPLINTDKFFDGQGKSEVIVILDVDNKQKALPIDEVMERREIVVKPLSNDFDTIKYILGASILGDGKAALILGIESLFKLSENK